MNNSIYLRPLVLDDAKISYKWRNTPEIWKYSRFDPKEHHHFKHRNKLVIRML